MSAEMTLYSADLSPFSARVRAGIYSKSLNIEIVPPPYELRSANFRAINPVGRIPVLVVHPDLVIPESEVILDYLEQRFPDKPLLPRATAARINARLLARVAELYAMPAIGALFPFIDGERNPEVITREINKLTEALRYISQLLERASRTLLTDQFSVADCMLVPMLFYIRIVEGAFDIKLIAPLPGLSMYVDALPSHPVAVRVMQEMQSALDALS